MSSNYNKIYEKDLFNQDGDNADTSLCGQRVVCNETKDETKMEHDNTENLYKIKQILDKLIETFHRLAHSRPEIVLENISKFEKFFRIIATLKTAKDKNMLDEFLVKIINQIEEP